jgi:hypothetical protein
MLAGQRTTGATPSRTVTVNEQLELLLPVLSEALQVTTVGPEVKVEPEAGAQVTCGLGSHESVAVTVN